MCYKMEIIRKEEYKTSQWAGGTTTELFIYPKDAIYRERNFKWRLSSAKVDVEESTFTHLPGILRIIMILEGELTLEHEGHHSTSLKPFEQDHFSGEWITRSFGKVVDFNLMMNQGCNGKVEVISMDKGEEKDILLNNKIEDIKQFYEIGEAFYCVNGNIEIIIEKEEKLSLDEGDLFLITRKVKDKIDTLKFLNSQKEDAKMIQASIYY